MAVEIAGDEFRRDGIGVEHRTDTATNDAERAFTPAGLRAVFSANRAAAVDCRGRSHRRIIALYRALYRTLWREGHETVTPDPDPFPPPGERETKSVKCAIKCEIKWMKVPPYDKNPRDGYGLLGSIKR